MYSDRFKPVVQGGQGRESEEMLCSTMTVALCLVGAAALCLIAILF
jgi:hypothetical protein